MKLDAGLYGMPALEKASRAFSHLAEIRIRRRGRYQVVVFVPFERSEPVDRLGDEFANYALSCLMVSQ